MRNPYDDDAVSMFAIPGMSQAIAADLVNYEKWGKALSLNPDTLDKLIMMRMSFAKMKELKLKGLAEQKEALLTAAKYAPEAVSDAAERAILNGFFEKLGVRFSFYYEGHVAQYTPEMIEKTLDHAHAIKDLVFAHEMARPMDPETQEALLEIEAAIQRISALPDSGDFPLEENRDAHSVR